MSASNTDSGYTKEAEEQIRSFLAKYDPKLQTLIRGVRKVLQKRFPTARELVYDYRHSFVIGYSPVESGSDSVVCIATGESGLRLHFDYRTKLPDPMKILLGSSGLTRFILLESVNVLKRPEVRALMDAASARAKISLPKRGPGKLIIKSNSAKQKPRRRPSQK